MGYLALVLVAGLVLCLLVGKTDIKSDKTDSDSTPTDGYYPARSGNIVAGGKPEDGYHDQV